MYKHRNLNNKDQYQKNFCEAKRFLREHDDILVLPSDKGNNTAIIKRSEYEIKMLELLNHDRTYSKLARDPTNKYQTQINNFVNVLKNNNYIDADVSKRLKAYNSVPPKIYGLPKLHKQNRPLRSIVSCVNSPGYKISRFLHDI